MDDISEGVAFGDLPALRDFMVSPGFTGAAVLVAVIIAVAALLYASGRATRKQLEQKLRLHEQAREDEQRAARIARCWDQLWRLVDKAEIDPAAHVAEEAMMGVGPEMAAELLRGLLRDAEELGDDTLTATIRTYLAQFALVLTQQGGPLDNGQAGAASPAPNSQASGGQPLPSSTAKKRTAAAGDRENPTPAANATAGEGRHR
jgi:hypothetical protein